MFVAPTPWSRFAAVLGVLATALGLLCGPAAAAPKAAEPQVAVTVFVTPDDTPGCEQAPSDGTGRPAAPPRSLTSYELMPALFEARGAVGGWGLDRLVVCRTAGRAPPPTGPPTPVDLSVLLRV
ncbi:hypothetical protein OG897_00140 [Streptomyces sp. NBC_00237]|uniref:hypothetical protein n=1 Tax=Streptomyces sp. NBC_00237 TaxID=2975687 RepID=UPI00225BD1E5|nr:hypothetical protein [Streptomyces sp. NBC_00237]MCX5199882.1 hypothetical protein [Streptomyces sp. NBC_00237]